MVSTRVVIAVSAFVLLLAFGSEWLAFSSNSARFSYTTFDIGTTLGELYGPCACPPSNPSIDGWFWHVMAPLLVAPGPLYFAIISFPVGFVLAVVSLFRWKLMVVAGALSILSGVFWIVGLNIAQTQVVRGLSTWFGYQGVSVSSAVWAQAGPYIAVFGGVILLSGYVLSRMDILEWPVD
ncbi:MAG TPA: hypothetical protein VK126_01170 [Nitrososphaerales archaeon]|nr:hypothetical protein [Nitrososphaerales archaeon]